MRYNLPPSWPTPPPGWAPPPDWQPDPSWPAPPPDWKFWVDDGPAADERSGSPVRPSSVGEEGQYFGTDRAWSDGASLDPAAGLAQRPSPPDALTPAPVELAPDQLASHHLGLRAMVRWEDERRYEIGAIGGLSADATEVRVQFVGSSCVPFLREQAPGGPTNPRLYVWM